MVLELKRITIMILFIVFCHLVFSGCASDDSAKKVGWSALGGAVTGAAVGYFSGSTKEDRLKNAAIGTFAGSAVGGIVGAIWDAWDKNDQKKFNKALEVNPKNQEERWTNPDTKTEYVVSPSSLKYREKGKICRDVLIKEKSRNGERRIERKKAYRESDGTWVIAKGD